MHYHKNESLRIEYKNILISPSTINYICKSKEGEEGKLVIAVKGKELILGAGPKQVCEFERTPVMNNHLDVLINTIKEMFDAQKEVRNSWLDFVSNNRLEVIAGCFIEFRSSEVKLKGKSLHFGPIPDQLFEKENDSLAFISQIVSEIRFGFT